MPPSIHTFINEVTDKEKPLIDLPWDISDMFVFLLEDFYAGRISLWSGRWGLVKIRNIKNVCSLSVFNCFEMPWGIIKEFHCS